MNWNQLFNSVLLSVTLCYVATIVGYIVYKHYSRIDKEHADLDKLSSQIDNLQETIEQLPEQLM